MINGICPKCDTEFETEYNSFYCASCGTQIKPGFRIKNGCLVFLNAKLEIESIHIGQDENNLYKILCDNLLKFACRNGVESGYVQTMLEENIVDLNGEYNRVRTEGDESYIHHIMKSKQVIEKVLALIRN